MHTCAFVSICVWARGGGVLTIKSMSSKTHEQDRGREKDQMEALLMHGSWCRSHGAELPSWLLRQEWDGVSLTASEPDHDMPKVMSDRIHLGVMWRLICKEAEIEAGSPIKTVIKVIDSQNWCFVGYEGNGWVKGDHRVSSQRNWIYDTAFKRKTKRGELSLEVKERAACVLGTARQLNETQHSTEIGSLRLIPANRRTATRKVSYLRGILRLASSPISLSLQHSQQKKSALKERGRSRMWLCWLEIRSCLDCHGDHDKKRDAFTIKHIFQLYSFILPANEGSEQLCLPSSLNWARNRPRTAPWQDVEIDSKGLSYPTLH